MAELRVIHGEEAVRHIGNLIETLLAASNLEEKFTIYKKVAFRGQR